METTIMLGAQFCGTLLWWIGIFLLTERVPMSTFQKRFVQSVSALLLMVWFAAIPLLAQNGFFLRAAGPLPALLLPLIVGFVLLFSHTFRKMLTVTPMHWIIGIQVFRVLGGVFLIGYVQGQLPGLFALPAGVGDILTGITAPLVAYWSYKNGKGARLITYIWNSFGALDLLDAITLATLAANISKTGPTTALLAALPFVLIPAFGVPRSLLLHGYTFWLLGKRRTEKAMQRSSPPVSQAKRTTA